MKQTTSQHFFGIQFRRTELTIDQAGWIFQQTGRKFRQKNRQDGISAAQMRGAARRQKIVGGGSAGMQESGGRDPSVERQSDIIFRQ
jgi:hypothetical protein